MQEVSGSIPLSSTKLFPDPSLVHRRRRLSNTIHRRDLPDPSVR
jgi:hypothetical protein